jgi:quercetin dioxygenase-like cupin family protein
MKLVKAWEEPGVEIPAPFQRCIKVLLAPDKEGVAELTFSQVLLPPGGRTEYHSHDRPELIFLVSGEGECLHEGEKTQVKEDMVIWMPAGEQHQMINSGPEMLKLATVFVPAYTAAENYRRAVEGATASKGEQA